MRNRLYFIPASLLSQILTWVTEDTIRDLCQKGEICSIKFGKAVLIPTICLRLKYPQLPIEFWEEITEDLYRELDGPTSARMRLERRREGRDPSTGHAEAPPPPGKP